MVAVAPMYRHSAASLGQTVVSTAQFNVSSEDNAGVSGKRTDGAKMLKRAEHVDRAFQAFGSCSS